MDQNSDAEVGRVPLLDDGDKEVLRMQKNEALMSYINECVERGRKGPTKSLAQIRAQLG